MSEDSDFFISELTFEKVNNLKIRLGFKEKTWDQFFSYVCHNEVLTEPVKDDIEKIMKKIHYESFDDWTQNFALNLNNIWNEHSAKELQQNVDETHERKSSAIIIGRGPSLKKHNHLELIANSDYSGSIICCDGALINALKAGITPEKFPKFFVVSIDPRDVITKYYDDPIVNEYGSKINGVFSTFCYPATVERARQSGMKIHWLHTLFDFQEGQKSLNKITAMMVRAKKHSKGLPAIQTGGNVGTSSWFVSWKILKCTTVALIGINHGWSEDDSWKMIITHGRENLDLEVDKSDPNIKKLFPKIYNPDFDCQCILDPTFQYYRNALIEFISRSPSWVSTVNATEGGSIFGDRIKSMTLGKFLENDSRKD